MYPSLSLGRVWFETQILYRFQFCMSQNSRRLLSVISLTKDLNCKVIFFPSHCIFQDLEKGVVISSGSLRGGLYWLDSLLAAPLQANRTDSCVTSLLGLQRWHRHLWHSPLSTLSLRFPELVNKFRTSEFFL